MVNDIIHAFGKVILDESVIRRFITHTGTTPMAGYPPNSGDYATKDLTLVVLLINAS